MLKGLVTSRVILLLFFHRLKMHKRSITTGERVIWGIWHLRVFKKPDSLVNTDLLTILEIPRTLVLYGIIESDRDSRSLVKYKRLWICMGLGGYRMVGWFVVNRDRMLSSWQFKSRFAIGAETVRKVYNTFHRHTYTIMNSTSNDKHTSYQKKVEE